MIRLLLYFFRGRAVQGVENKLKLYGFNNLTKSLSFNIYDVCYAKSEREQRDYIAYIDEQYNSERLTDILYHVTEMIGAQVLNVSRQDYDPQGASVAFLIAEQAFEPDRIDPSCNLGAGVLRGAGNEIVAHLNKSHATVHTYPEYHPDNAIATFRVDIDISTCGEITPLDTLNYLIGSFDSDIITADYRVRGFTRDLGGKSCSSTIRSRRSRITSTKRRFSNTTRSISTSIRRTCSIRSSSSRRSTCRTTCSTPMSTSFRRSCA